MHGGEKGVTGDIHTHGSCQLKGRYFDMCDTSLPVWPGQQQ